MTVSSSAPETFNSFDEAEQLDRLIAGSHQRPVVIFKHSRTCGTSAQAFDELQDLLGQDLEAEVYVVDVLRSRPVSQAIAARFAIRHESPQALVLRGGQVTWHGSHYRVTAEAIRQALFTSTA